MVVDGGHMDVTPCRRRLLLPVAERLQAELEHPLGFPFLGRDEPDDILVQSFLNDFRMYVRREAELVLLFGYLTNKLILLFH